MTATPNTELAALRAAFDETWAAINALPPDEAFEVARELLPLCRELVDRAHQLRDIQVARIYDSRSMTLAQLAAKTRWGASRDGQVTRGRMSQIVTRGRQLQGDTDDEPPTDPPPEGGPC